MCETEAFAYPTLAFQSFRQIFLLSPDISGLLTVSARDWTIKNLFPSSDTWSSLIRSTGKAGCSGSRGWLIPLSTNSMLQGIYLSLWFIPLKRNVDKIQVWSPHILIVAFSNSLCCCCSLYGEFTVGSSFSKSPLTCKCKKKISGMVYISTQALSRSFFPIKRACQGSGGEKLVHHSA